MSDYIDRQVALDALGVTKNATKYGGDHSGYDTRMLYEIHDALTGIPAADVVPVVRCKDCKHFYFTNNRIPQEQRYVCEISGEIWKPDSFCSYGERRGEQDGYHISGCFSYRHDNSFCLRLLSWLQRGHGNHEED